LSGLQRFSDHTIELGQIIATAIALELAALSLLLP
jgi:hypothetical protein